MKKQVLKYKGMTKKELAEFLCDLVEDVVDATMVNGPYVHCCDVCPAQNECYDGHLGFLDWLNDENV